MKRIFEGVKVLDFTINVAGPSATAILGDHGANIVKIERPVAGDDARHFAPSYDGSSVQFWWVSRNKKSVTVDLTDPEGLAFVKKLAADADIICESFRPGVMKKYGLDYDSVSQFNPTVVYCSVSAFGQTGPYSNKPGYDLIAQALSGVIDLTGPKGGTAQKVGVFMGDYTASLNAYAGIVTAYCHKLRTGSGQHVDVSLVEGLMAYNSSIEVASATGKDVTRNGNHANTLCPYGIYEGRDHQSIVIATASDKLWALLCRTIGKAEVATLPEFSGNDERCKNQDKVVALIEGWLCEFEDIHAALNILEEAGVPCCGVKTTREVIEDPHLIVRGSIVDLSPPQSLVEKGVQDVKARGPWIKFSKTPAQYAQAPDLGQHNHEIMGAYGLSVEKIDELQERWTAKAKAK